MRRLYLLWLFVLSWGAVTTAALLSFYEETRIVRESSLRAAYIASSLGTSLEDTVGTAPRAYRLRLIAKTIERLRKKPTNDVLGMVLCESNGDATPIGFASNQGGYWTRACKDRKNANEGGEAGWTLRMPETEGQRLALVHAREVAVPENSALFPSSLLIVQDLDSLHTVWTSNFVYLAILIVGIGLGIFFLVTRQVRGWLRTQVDGVRKALRSAVVGRRPDKMLVPQALAPLSRDIERLANEVLRLSSPVARRRKDATSVLNQLRTTMQNRRLTVVANREPYIHERIPAGSDGSPSRIEVIRPASGLVSALEPILRNCGGRWVAHGSGSADLDVVDEDSEVAVPPGAPRYSLKRVWLTSEQERGYYYGFANEGLWPLCHLAHTRPVFRLKDWQHYTEVNQKFRNSIGPREFETDSLILVQDYHFALLPRMLRERSSSVKGPRIGLFWHIPWPNPEAFGICPWGRDLLKGMLGADVIGFHTQYHCNNFLETCNRYLEARIDYERFSVTMENRETKVRAFPIGIDTSPVRMLSDSDIRELKKRYGIQAEFVAVGVDRLDYTKGLVERVQAVERFLEKNPSYIGRFSLVQMGSPSRSSIPAYRLLNQELQAAVDRLNARYESTETGYKPVILLASHHDWGEIQYFYQLGDLCMVTSLHDGMNLVAKEYVWCQRPDRGSLILSRFTGASRELTEAFIVNPYSIEEMADAISSALALPTEERFRRMNSMREKVQEHNAYHWAREQIEELVRCGEGVTAVPRELVVAR